jgi:hypothetical protein
MMYSGDSEGTKLRRVWRYQRGNQNPYNEEKHITQWPKEKVQKDKQRYTKYTYKTKDRPHSRLITGFVTRLTRLVPLVEQEMLTLPDHLSSPPILSGARVTRSLVLYVYFVYRCLSFCTFSFGHCVICFSSLYGFWLPLWCPTKNRRWTQVIRKGKHFLLH